MGGGSPAGKRGEFFDHVDAHPSPGLIQSWPLPCFVGAFLDDADL
jgi:hypothetical protein